MPRAIVRDGVIYPLDPLPPEWGDGRELVVEEAPQETPDEIDRWFEEFEQECAAGDSAEDQKVQAAIDEAKAQAKALVRREMGLE